MRFVRLFAAFLVLSVVASFVSPGGPLASAQTSDQAKEDADAAERRARAADGLVDEAVANRDEIERQLVDSITRMNELATQLSEVGADLDQVASHVGYVDVELAGIQSDIEHQAVSAYMTLVGSPSLSLVSSASVETALVANSVMDDVVADGRLTVAELFTKRKKLEELKATYLADQERYQTLKAQIDDEVAHYTVLYEEADAEVADAIREAEAANQEYLAALSALELARAKEDERRRQEERTTTTTSTTTTTTASSPATRPNTTATTSGPGGGDWDHPPEVERWRDLVETYFPSNRVEEALRIIGCESNGDPDALNPYTGAAGLFQFLPPTWETVAPRAGFGDASVFDPEASIGSAAWLAGRYEDLGYYYWTPWNCKRVLG